MKVISSLVGAALLIAALLLSYQSAKGGENMKIGKEKIMTQYMAELDKALSENDIDGALKYAKKAIQFDPNSKIGFDAYEKVMEVKYKPAEVVAPIVAAPVVEKAPQSVSKVTKSEPKVVVKPKAVKEVEKVAPAPEPVAAPVAPKPKKSMDEEMGC